MQVRIRLDRLSGDQSALSVTLENGVIIPMNVPASCLPAVILGRSYDCELTTDGQFKNICETPPPVLTVEQVDWLRAYHSKMFGKPQE